jgi:hypothetical protein
MADGAGGAFGFTGPQIGAAGTGLEAFAALAQGIAARRRVGAITDYNAQVATANAQAQAQAGMVQALQYERQAQITRQDEVLLQQAQTWREARQGDQQAQVLGQTRAIIGASGLQMEGSPLTTYEETIRQHSLDTLAGRYQTTLAQRATEEQAVQQDYAAQMARYGAGERLRVGSTQVGLLRATEDTTQVQAGLLRAGGGLIQGAAQYEYQQARLKAPLVYDQSLLGGQGVY